MKLTFEPLDDVMVEKREEFVMKMKKLLEKELKNVLVTHIYYPNHFMEAKELRIQFRMVGDEEHEWSHVSHTEYGLNKREFTTVADDIIEKTIQIKEKEIRIDPKKFDDGDGLRLVNQEGEEVGQGEFYAEDGRVYMIMGWEVDRVLYISDLPKGDEMDFFIVKSKHINDLKGLTLLE